MSRSEPSANDTISTQLPPERQRTYLVFETFLLLLFTMCVYCGNAITKSRKKSWDHFCTSLSGEKSVKENACGIVNHTYIGNIPASNILASASIFESTIEQISVLYRWT